MIRANLERGPEGDPEDVERFAENSRGGGGAIEGKAALNADQHLPGVLLCDVLGGYLSVQDEKATGVDPVTCSAG